MDSNTTRPEHYKSASEAGKPFLLKLHPFSDEDFETQCHLVLEKLHWHNDAYLFQAAAYLWRLGKKDSITQDLEKALWYLERRAYVGIDLPRWAQPVSGVNAIAAIEKYLAGIKIDGWDDKRYQPISQIGRPFLRSLGVYDYFRECAWTKAIDRIEQERISSFFYLSAVKYLYFCRDNELTILDLQEAKWHLQYWLSSSVPKNPRVRRRAEETVIAIEGYLAGIKPNEQ